MKIVYALCIGILLGAVLERRNPGMFATPWFQPLLNKDLNISVYCDVNKLNHCVLENK